MRKQLSEKNCGSEKSRQAKIGGAEGGVWCGREFHGGKIDNRYRCQPSGIKRRAPVACVIPQLSCTSLNMRRIDLVNGRVDINELNLTFSED